jgi:hypothetical protein
MSVKTTVQFFECTGHGKFQALPANHIDGEYSHVVSGNFSGGNYPDLLFYDAKTGDAAFYCTDGKGNITNGQGNVNVPMAKHTWGKDWKLIVSGNFSKSQFSDLLFYKASDPRARPGRGYAEFYCTDGQGNITLMGKPHTDWRATWHLIVPVTFTSPVQHPADYFVGNALLFYSQADGLGEFYATDGQGNLMDEQGNVGRWMKQYTGWMNTWDLIVPLPYGLDRNDDGDALLFYAQNDPREVKGVGEFYRTGGQGQLLDAQGNVRSDKPVARYNDWAKNWKVIKRGRFGGAFEHDLIFYDGMRLECYEVDDKGDMVSHRHLMDRLVEPGVRTWLHIVTGNFFPGQRPTRRLYQNSPVKMELTDLVCYSPWER